MKLKNIIFSSKFYNLTTMILFTLVFVVTDVPANQRNCAILENREDHKSFNTFSSGFSKLMEAAYFGKVDDIGCLLQKGASIDKKDNNGKTALIWGAQGKRYEVVKLLLKKGSNINIKDNDGRTALAYAASKGTLDIVKFLIKKGVNANVIDSVEYTPLLLAAAEGHIEIVNKLIDSGVDDNVIRNHFGSVALVNAAAKGNLDAVSFLIKKGAKINAKVKIAPAYMVASWDNYTEINKLLDQNGARLKMLPVSDSTALMQAALRGHDQVVSLLIKKSAGVYSKDVNGKTALMYAAERGSAQTIKTLLANAADIHGYDKSGTTPLMTATERGRSAIVKLFVDNKVDVNQTNFEGTTALDLAIENGYTDISAMLIHVGAVAGRSKIPDLNEKSYREIEKLFKCKTATDQESVFACKALDMFKMGGNVKIDELDRHRLVGIGAIFNIADVPYYSLYAFEYKKVKKKGDKLALLYIMPEDEKETVMIKEAIEDLGKGVIPIENMAYKYVKNTLLLDYYLPVFSTDGISMGAINEEARVLVRQYKNKIIVIDCSFKDEDLAEGEVFIQLFKQSNNEQGMTSDEVK